MTDALEPRPNRRQQAKARTRAKVIDAARRLFVAKGYAAATIRDIAREAGMSTGAVFANFTDKADLWRAVKGSEPPVETSVTRAASAMLTALRDLQAVRPVNWDDADDAATFEAWTKADAAVALAEGRE
jgi:AcrR family transcriptional regulator